MSDYKNFDKEIFMSIKERQDGLIFEPISCRYLMDFKCI